MRDIQKEIKEAVQTIHEKTAYASDITTAQDYIKKYAIEFVTHQQQLIESQAKEIDKANGLLRKLNAYIDFDEHLDNGDWGIEDASGINELFDEVRHHLSINTLGGS